MTFKVDNVLFGKHVGTFTVDGPAALWDAVARHSGCKDFKDMCSLFGSKDPAKLRAEMGLVATLVDE